MDAPSPYFSAYAANPPPAPEYGASGGMPDFRYRESGYAGNSAFAPPGGVRTGMPLADLAINLVTQAAFPGQEFRPMGGNPVGGDIDYLNARGRSNQMMQAYPSMLAMGGVAPPDSQLGQNPVFQMFSDPFKYGGSTVGAFQSAYGKLGHVFGDSPQKASAETIRLMESMQGTRRSDGTFEDGVFTTNGQFDYDKSFGFNRSESVDNVDSALRFGLGGKSRAEFAADVREGRGGQYVAQANEVTRMGKNTFGQDQSADQINDLLDKATGGLAGVTPEKATEFLAKIQAVSRAVDTNARAFAEYAAMQNKVNEQLGIGGAVSSEMITQSALGARVTSDHARQTGDAVLKDQNVVQAANDRAAAADEGSTFKKQLRFAAARADQMDAGENAQAGVDGQTADQNFATIRSLLRQGKGDEAEDLFGRYKDKNGRTEIEQGGLNLSKEDAVRSLKRIDAGTGADQAQQIRNQATRLAYENATRNAGFDGGAISQSVYQDAVSDLNGVQMSDRKEVEKALVAKGIDPAVAHRQSLMLANGADVAIGNASNYAAMGATNDADVRNQLENSRAGHASAVDEAKRSVDVNIVRETNLGKVMGTATRPINVQEEIGRLGADALAEYQKTGKLTPEMLKKIGGDAVQGVTQTNKITGIFKSYGSGALDKPLTDEQVAAYRRGEMPVDPNAPAAPSAPNTPVAPGDPAAAALPGSTPLPPAPADGRAVVIRPGDPMPAAQPDKTAAMQDFAPRGTPPPTAKDGESDTPKEQLTETRKSRTTLEEIRDLLKNNPNGTDRPAPTAANSTGL